jgi:hypothetical protein
MPETNTRFFIEVNLPAPLNAVADLLSTVGKHWPKGTIDLNHPGGWKIAVGPEHEADKPVKRRG